MKKLRFYYWLVKGFIQKHKMVLGLSALMGAVSVILIPLMLRYAPEPKPTHYVGRVGSYSLSNLPKDIQQKVSNGLVVVDDSGSFVPDLADSWNTLDDGKTYVFTLKEGITWQDGSLVSAYDIDYTINQVEKEVRDDRTIVFKLEDAYSPFPSILNQPIFKRVQKKRFGIIDVTQVLGTGTYQLKKLKIDGNSIDSLLLESDAEKIVYKFFPTEQAALLAFKLAEIDAIEGISDVRELSNWSNVTIEKDLHYDQYVAVFFNLADDNLSSKQLRQALNYMTPKKTDPLLRTVTPLNPSSWAYNPNVKPYEYSQETASELMKGLTSDFDLELVTTPTFVDLAETIKDSWASLGINVQLKIVNLPDTNNYQSLLIGQKITPDPDQYLLWHSTQPTNITNYESVKVDKLLEDGRREQDQEKRREIYLDFQRFLVEDSPAVFLHYLESYSVTRGK